MARFLPTSILLLLSACGSTPALDTTRQPADLDSWAREVIPLPPGFAPDMPAGDEQLLFAPGMFDAASEQYWSYAFALRLEESGLDAARLTAIFELYYDGLIFAVAQGKDADVGDDPAQVRMRSVGDGRFEGTIDLIDAFVTLEPVQLRLVIDARDEATDTTWLKVQASPRAPGHGIWPDLEAAADLALAELRGSSDLPREEH
ncbi:hypothetical protein [Engelhardtia mirabilis]|uniref:ABC-type transport auxiliary lipoprotein component domain-containing protein n=1 Tax=Engelhardtia mirabilis TaxID=2528011 RepID=A0A518BEB5_9BACT|nr:hypothetical protein Pla133_04000 [Planctomycetes bacterium Pla133]QDU99661.1 hypothetical protein Pla86_04000 [Planctomycetes bacterium Pla86]